MITLSVEESGLLAVEESLRIKAPACHLSGSVNLRCCTSANEHYAPALDEVVLSGNSTLAQSCLSEDILGNKAPSCHLTNTDTMYLKLKQDVDSCSQHIECEWNSNTRIFLKRRKFHTVHIPVELHVLVLILCLSFGNVVCRLHGKLHNVAETVGKGVFMSCASNRTVNPCQDMVWTHNRAHTFVSRVICMGDNVSPLVSNYISIVRTNDGNCILEIKTQTSAEGTYECTSTTTGKKESASLIILDFYPECNVKTVVNETGEYSNITCWVEYFGDWAPTMEWIAMTGQTTTGISSYESYTSDQIVSANLLIPRNVSAGYMCIMKFTEQGRKTRTTATNVPHYEWISPIFGEYGREARREETTESMPRCEEIDSGHASNKTGVIVGIVILILILIVTGTVIWKKRRCILHKWNAESVLRMNATLSDKATEGTIAEL